MFVWPTVTLSGLLSQILEYFNGLSKWVALIRLLFGKMSGILNQHLMNCTHLWVILEYSILIGSNEI